MQARKRTSTGWRTVKVSSGSERRVPSGAHRHNARAARQRKPTSEYLSPWRDSFKSIQPEKISILNPPTRSERGREDHGPSDFAIYGVSRSGPKISLRMLTMIIMAMNVLMLAIIFLVSSR